MRGARLDLEITKRNKNFEIHSARLTLYSLKPSKSPTHNDIFF